jgi:NADH-quinone oxidoreductase subunit M
MSLEAILLHLVVWLPLIGAILIGILGGTDQHAPRRWAAGVMLVTLALSLWLFAAFNRAVPGFQFDSGFMWLPPIRSYYRLGVDGISLPLLILNTLLGFLAVVISWNQTHRPQLYFAILLTLQTAVSGVFTSLDFFLFFLFWELELIPMYLLIGIWGGPRREYAAMKFIVYTVVGSAFMLLGILALFFFTGGRSFDMVELSAAARTLAPTVQVGLFLLLAIGFAVKVPIFPFHTWLPDAHVEAPTAGSVLLAGVLLKMGGYGLLRLCVNVLPQAAQQLAWLLAVLAVINIIYGAMVALGQTDLKKMIANSSISHMGYVILGLAALSQIGFQGAVFQMVTHGTITGLLFMMVGVVYDRTHTREIPRMAGLAQRMPLAAALFVVAALASLGLPGMSGFVGEFLVFIGAFPVWQWYTGIGAFAIVITAGYLLWMLARVFMGPLGDEWREHHLTDMSAREGFAVGTLVAVIVLVGVFPNVIAEMIASSVGPIARLFG